MPGMQLALRMKRIIIKLFEEFTFLEGKYNVNPLQNPSKPDLHWR